MWLAPSGSPGAVRRGHRDGVRSAGSSWAPESNVRLSRHLLPVSPSTGGMRPPPGLDAGLATQAWEQLLARTELRS